jgi:hypothetical protein
MKKHKNKQEILDDLSKKEFFDEKASYSDFFMYYMDGVLCDFKGQYFDMWLNDPQRLRDEKIDELLGLSKKNRVGDFFPKDFGDK